MSDLLDAAKRLLEVLDRDHSLSERHTAQAGLAEATKDATPEGEAA